MTYRMLIAAAAALALLVGVTGMVAQDKDTEKGKGAGEARSYEGKVATVDAGKRELTLEGVKGRRGDKAAGEAGEKGAGRKVLFQVVATVNITLDGRPAELRDLKEGMYAKVYTKKAGGEPTGVGEKAGTDDKAGAGTAVRRMTAERIEARTKGAPTGIEPKKE
jgi:hypothetical protein